MATPSLQLAAQATPLGSSLILDSSFSPTTLIQAVRKSFGSSLENMFTSNRLPPVALPWPGLPHPPASRASCLCPGSPSFTYTHNRVIAGKLKSDYPTALLTTLQQLPTSLALKSKPLQWSSRPDDMLLSVPVLPASSLFLEHTYLISLPGRLVPQMSAWPTPSPPPRLDTHLTFPCMP